MSDCDRYAGIRAIVTDVDGVLTDGTVCWSASGEESKSFSFEDIMGFSRARRAGLELGLISGEDSPLVDRFAQKVGITFVVKGCKEKGEALREFSRTKGIALRHIAYIGDDVNDISALKLAGLSAAPSNAQPPVKAIVHCVLDSSGGRGAARQLIERVLSSRHNETPLS